MVGGERRGMGRTDLMAGQQGGWVALTNLRGRDGSTASVGVDPEHGGIPLDKCLEARNVDGYRASVARKRGGSATLTLTSSNFAGIVTSLAAHIPGTAYTAHELWGIDAGFIVGRLAGGATWANPTL